MASGRAVMACKKFSSLGLFQKATLCQSFNIKPVSSLLQNFSLRGLSTQDRQPSQQTEDDLYSKIMIEVKGHDPKVLDSYYWYLKQTAYHLDLGPNDTYVQKKPVIDKLTLNKSVHVYKKHRVQYEARTHYRTFIYYYLTGSTASTFLEYIQRNLPEGVAMKVTKFKMERLPEHLGKETVFSLEEKETTGHLLPKGTEDTMEIPNINIDDPNMRKRDIRNNLFKSLLDSNFETCRLYDRKNKHLESEQKEAISSELQQTEMITSEPEHREVVSSEPEHTEVISSEPERTEVISSEPEHTEVISSKPEHREVISSEPKKDVQKKPTKTDKLEIELSDSQSEKDAEESDTSSSSSDSDSDSDDENEEDKKNDEKEETEEKPDVKKDKDLEENTSKKDPKEK
ncbi:uncharacterized protein LOC111128042 isoform X1 [Crassostrea virginica]